MEPNHDELVPLAAAVAVDHRDVALVRGYAIGAMLLAAAMVLASVVACVRAQHGTACGIATMGGRRG